MVVSQLLTGLAGWYLSYWEYARAVFACARFDDDWSE